MPRAPVHRMQCVYAIPIIPRVCGECDVWIQMPTRQTTLPTPDCSMAVRLDEEDQKEEAPLRYRGAPTLTGKAS